MSRWFPIFIISIALSALQVSAAGPAPIRVACVGDSITFGAGIQNRDTDSYPAQLQRLLGDGYQVRNFGVSGRTLLKKGDSPYWECDAWLNSLAFKPNIVVIKLGTNDTKPQNWQYQSEFTANFREMIQRYRELDSKPIIYLCKPVPAFPERWGIRDTIIKNELIPLIDQLAQEETLPAIDLYTPFVGHGELLPDQIHPNAQGAGIMARVIYASLTGKPYRGLNYPGILTEWNGFPRTDFVVAGKDCILVAPHQAAPGNPWIWRARFFGHEPQTDIALLNRGFHLAYMDVANLYGCPAAVALWDQFYKLLTEEYQLSAKPALEGMSRGGLIIYNWAKQNPTKVACLYADAPVCDIRSWPGGKGRGPGNPNDWKRCLAAYGITEEQLDSFKGNPIDNLEPLAKAGVPALHVCGAADTDVPIEENTRILEKAYRELGGNITVIAKPGVAHHPHSLADPTYIVDFILRHTVGSGDYFVMRDGLDNCRVRFERDKAGTVAFLGGSITFGGGWRNLVMADLQKRFPDTKFRFINAGIPSTGSTPGAFRLTRDVFGEGPVDLLFEEAAVNDSTNTRTDAEMIRGMEGIVRHARLINPALDVVIMHFVDPDKMKEYNVGQIPTVIRLHEQVAETYQVNSINLALEVTERIRNSEFTWEGDFKDLHPAPFGHKIYANTIGRLFDYAWSKPQAAGATIRPHRMPGEMIDPASYAGGKLGELSKAVLKDGWKLDPQWQPTDKAGTRPGFVAVPMVTAQEPGAELVYPFEGNAIGIFVAAGPDAGIIEYAIDGGPFQLKDQFTPWSRGLHIPWAHVLAAGLKPGKHELTLRIAAQSNAQSTGHAARIVHFLVNESVPARDDGYAIVISQSTWSDPAWREVAEILQAKHSGTIIRYDKDLPQALEELKRQFPQFVCLVATPAEAGRDFVAQAHQVLRQLDDDPYTDAIWGILTGYTPEDAQRIAKLSEPLTVKRILTGTVGSPMDGYESGRMYNELKANQLWVKPAGGAIEQQNCPTDITELIARDMNEYNGDVWITSGHATEKDWNPGYGYRCGNFRCENGVVYGKDLAGKRYDIDSANPKVLLAIGNCLIGHVSDLDCMALAFMHSAGVYQMLGYTVPTWYGYGGWGVKDYFSELQAGRFTLAQANYVNNLALVYELEKTGGKDKGLAYDRDVVVLYGDPAWPARLEERTLPWRQELSEKDGLYTFRMIANQQGDWDNRPVVELLPHRVGNIELVKGQEYQPVIMDNFILVPVNKKLEPMKGNQGEVFPIQGDYEAGTTLEIQFRARPLN